MNTYFKKLWRNIERVPFLCGMMGLAYSGQAQEFLTGIGVNAQIMNESQLQQKKRLEPPTIFLPFFDDFSNYTGYPNQNLFIDKQAFVNNTFPVHPPTIGVVTLDALNEKGKIYEHLNQSSKGADTLTSCYIRLDSLMEADTLRLIEVPRDSLFFSFYFQPGGAGLQGSGAGERIGSQPNLTDSLVLEFGYGNSDTTDTVWDHIWSTPGFSVDEWTSDTLTPHQYFKQIMIHIKDDKYLCNKFQFRFRNYASLEPQQGISGWEGNVDQWHIDYIRLDVNRGWNDKYTNDLAFVSPTTSFLQNYQSMPWKQFEKADIKPNFTNELSNLNSGKRTPKYKYTITKYGVVVKEYVDMWLGSQDIDSYEKYGLYDNPLVTKPSISNSFYSKLTDTASYVITHIFTNNSGDDFCTANDTCVFKQKFYDYYAYDDGTAEFGYCLNNQFNVAYLAMNFPLRIADSLSAVRMWFNHTKNSENEEARFSIVVWKDDNGKPGTVLFKTDEYRPRIDTTKFLSFVEYRFNKKYFVSEENKNIWIGFEQKGNVQLNIGFDQNISSELFILNSNPNTAIFKYNTNGNWTISSFRGVPMLRPVFGEPLNLSVPKNLNISNTKIFPNPTSGQLRITNYELRIENVEIYDIFGKKCHASCGMRHENIDISHLPTGIYLVRIYLENNSIETHKLIKY